MTRLARGVAVATAAIFLSLACVALGAGSDVTHRGEDATLAPREPGAVARAAALRRPSGTYTGRKGTLTLVVSGRSIDLAAFDFPCRKGTGRTGLNGVSIVKRRGRYRFSIRAHGIATYSDGSPDQNAVIRLSGRFTPRAVRAVGLFRVRTPHCGRTGPVEFMARR